MSLVAAVYRLALSFWVGGMALFTFVVTPVIFRSQGREAAGKIVGALFPLYFRCAIAAISVAFLARLAAEEAFHGARQWAGTLLIVTALVLAAYQTYGLAPRMERVKASTVSFEAAPPDDPARREFSRLHGYSMAINLVILLEGAALVVAYETFRM